MANQILAGAVVQASQVIAGIDANNPPYVGPPPRIVAMRQFIYQTDPGDSTVYTMAMDGTDLQTLPFPDGLVQDKNGDYARNIASDGNKVVVSDEDNGRVFVYDMSTGAAPTSFAVAELDNRVNSMMLSGTRLFTHDSGSSGVHIYDITTGEKVGNYSNSDGTGFLRSTVSGGKFIGIPYDPTNSNQRSMYIYEVGDNDGSSEIKVDLPDLTNPYQQHNVSLAAGEGKIVYGTESTDATFYIWDINGTNRIDVDTSSFMPGGYWGSSMTMAGRRVGHWASAIGNGKIVINSDFAGLLFVCNLDGSDLNAIDLYNLTPSSEHYKFAGMASTNDGYLAIADGKVIAPALNGKTDTSDNEPEGIIWILDLHQRTVLAQIESPVLDESVRFGRDFGAYFTAATSLSVSGIESAYTLLSGGTNIYATSTVGGVTWSYEEPGLAGASYAIADSSHDASNGTQNVGRVYLYDADGSNERIIESPVQSANYMFGESVFVTEDKVVVGAPEDTENGFRSGAVWVFDHDGSNQVKITASDGAQADSFGRYVSAGDGKIAVGAPDEDYNGVFSTGAVYLYDIDGSNEIKIVASDTHQGQEFGSRVVVAHGKVYISAIKDDEKGNQAGAVYIYNLDGSFDKKLLPGVSSGSNLHFGEGLAVSNTHILISKRSLPGDSLDNEGRVQVFDLDGNYLFRLNNPTPENSDYFGYSVAANEDKFVIGSIEANGNTGSVYIYDTDGTNEIKVNPAGLAEYAQFGRAVSIIGNRVIASSYRGIFSFALDGSDIQEITPAGSTDYAEITLSSFNSASQLNGTTVTQNDNVFTVTPGTEDASFDLTFTATDSSGSSASSTASFTFEAPEAQVGPATSVTYATFWNEGWSLGTEVNREGNNYEAYAQWIMYDTVGDYGYYSGKPNIADTSTPTGQVHWLRYDPVGKRIWALMSKANGDAEITLQNHGFGGWEDFFSGFYYNNFTYASSAIGGFPGIAGSKNTYEVEELAGLGITWDGTTWSKS